MSHSSTLSRFRRSALPVLLGVGAALVSGCSRPESALHSDTVSARGEPPQFLPITARWCLQSDGRSGVPSPPCVELEVPRGQRQITMGMQMRPPLPPLRGMWFPFDPPARVKFWMHRTPSPLDMIFVRDGRVIAVEADVPPCMRLPCPAYGPDVPIEGVVELGTGQAAVLGIRVGTAVRIEELADGAQDATARPSGTERSGEKIPPES